MAARFYKGASIQATRDVTPAGRQSPRTNTMKGMPGRIAGGGSATNILTAKGGAGPKREGAIGQKGGAHRANNQSGRGTTTKSYRAASTGHPGRIESLIGKARMSTEK